MTREEWQHVKEILHTALEVPRADRAAYLDQTCDGNADLRCEVESLLASHDDAGTFLEEPVAARPKLAGSDGRILPIQPVGSLRRTQDR